MQSQWEKFDFYFGLHLADMLFMNCDNFSAALQGKEKSAAKGQELAKVTVQTLKSIRNDAHFELHSAKVARSAVKDAVQPPTLQSDLLIHIMHKSPRKSTE